MAFFTRLIFALIGMAFAVLFAVGVLCWLALYVVFACLRWLVTGQKPQVLLMWQQIQAMRKGMRNGMQRGQGATWSSWSRSRDGQWHEAHGHTSSRDEEAVVIEDAVVREISDHSRLPKN
jgi:hypothetical protein